MLTDFSYSSAIKFFSKFTRKSLLNILPYCKVQTCCYTTLWICSTCQSQSGQWPSFPHHPQHDWPVSFNIVWLIAGTITTEQLLLVILNANRTNHEHCRSSSSPAFNVMWPIGDVAAAGQLWLVNNDAGPPITDAAAMAPAAIGWPRHDSIDQRRLDRTQSATSQGSNPSSRQHSPT